MGFNKRPSPASPLGSDGSGAWSAPASGGLTLTSEAEETPLGLEDHRGASRLAITPLAVTMRAAFERTDKRTRHLLLGNGFSINARSSFHYRSLFERAQPFSAEVESLFRELGTEDFERVLDVLRRRMSEPALAGMAGADLQSNEAEVREAFLRSLSTVHPDHAMLMGPEETDACAQFLERFVGRNRPQKIRGRIFTTNYDLLLYWVAARHGRKLICYDSHYRPFPNARYGLWDSDKWPSLVYLHGALHLYSIEGGGQGELRYDGRTSLIGQTRERLERGSFPVIVAEGTSPAKEARIADNPYLSWAGQKLRASMHDPNGALFTFGHSLSDRDAHLFRRIGEGRVRSVCLGIWGGLEGPEGEVANLWTKRWAEARHAQRKQWPLEVFVYDTSKVSPWRRGLGEID